MFKGVIIFVVMVGASVAADRAEAATTVTLRFQGPEGQAVALSSAELLFSGWGYADHVELKPEGNVIRLVLDPGAEREPGEKYSQAEQTFLYVEAEGYASWRSERFDWPEGPSFAPMKIGPVAIAPIDTVTGTITLRRATTRRIRLVDESGAPVTNVGLEVSMFWSNASHCGYFRTGTRPLLTTRTDSNGAVLVPDVDSEYGLELDGPHVAFVDEAVWPYQAIVRLSQGDNTVRIHRYRQRPLRTKVVNRGAPVKGAMLMVDLELGTCGAGSEPMGESGPDGVISVPDFYPEEWPFATVCYANKGWWAGRPANGVPQIVDIANAVGEDSYLCGR